MRESNRFFRILNQVNAILFFFGGLGALGLIAVLFSGSYRDYQPAFAGHAEKKVDYSYNLGGTLSQLGGGALERIDGTNEAMMVLERSDGSRGGGSFSGSRGAAADDVNVLLIDLETMKSRWMFPGLNQDISFSFLVRANVPVQEGTPDPVVAMLIGVATADTNGDGKIGSADDHALYLYRPGSIAPVKLLEAQMVSTVQQLDSARVLVTYYDGKTDQAAVLATKDFAPIAHAPLAATPK